jgi:queuosine precursor transporter
MRKSLEIFKFQKLPEPPTHSNPQSPFHYNYLLGLVMLYMMFMILSGITVYKLVDINNIIIPAGVLVTPFIYSISNIITEVYGYPVSRNMMWWFILVSAIFTLCGYILSHLPSPPNFKNQSAYSLIY